MFEITLRNGYYNTNEFKQKNGKYKFFTTDIIKIKDIKDKSGNANKRILHNLSKGELKKKLINSKSVFINHSKDKLEKSHDIMQQEELNKFRKEIEEKCRKSDMNKNYIFPRTITSIKAEFLSDEKIDCNLPT